MITPGAFTEGCHALASGLAWAGFWVGMAIVISQLVRNWGDQR